MTTDIGTALRNARESRGIPLQEIARRTKISVGALEALERLDFARLPEGIFGRAFVRAYALEVGLDPDGTVQAFIAEKVRHERDRATARARPQVTEADREFLARQRRAIMILRRTAAIVAGVLLLIAIGLGVRWWLARPAAPDGAAATTAPARPPVDLPLPAEAAAPAGLPPAESGVSDGLVIDLETTSECWVQATADGLVVLSRLMRQGDHERLQATRELVLDVGSAGDLRWTINGKPARALGRAGVHRQVRVTRDNVADFLQ